MKKLIFVILFILLTVSSGCCIVSESDVSQDYNRILSAFDTKDKKELKSIFAKKIRETSDFDNQITKAFSIYKGNINKVDFKNEPVEEKSVEMGVVKKESCNEFTVKTDKNRYRFYYEAFYNESDDSENGLTYLCIESEYNPKHENSVEIGKTDLNW